MGATVTWKILTMEEIWDSLFEGEDQKVFHKPIFPTRRWGQSFTKTSTTCKQSVQKILNHYKSKGFKVRKRIDRSDKAKLFRNLGIFYYIEIQK